MKPVSCFLGFTDGGDSGEDGEQGRGLHHQVRLYPLRFRGTRNIEEYHTIWNPNIDIF